MSSYAARLTAIREAIAMARALQVNAKQEDVNMTNLLTRIEQLAGAEVAKAIQAEFGGAAPYIPAKSHGYMFGCNCKPISNAGVAPDTAAPSRQLVLHVDVHPSATLISAKCAIAEAVTHMRACGVHVRDIGVDMRGMGSTLAAELRAEPTIGARISPIAGPGAKK